VFADMGEELYPQYPQIRGGKLPDGKVRDRRDSRCEPQWGRPTHPQADSLLMHLLNGFASPCSQVLRVLRVLFPSFHTHHLPTFVAREGR